MAHRNSAEECPPGYEYIYVRSFFHKKLGRRVYASECGKKCFRLKIRAGARRVTPSAPAAA